MEQEPLAKRPDRHRRPKPAHDLIFKIRQVLNVLFMLLGVIAAAMYSGWLGKIWHGWGSDTVQQMGAVLAIIAISMKMAECVLRCKKGKDPSEL